MKKTQTSKALIILAVVALLGIVSYAFADWGMGYGRHMGYGWGSGYGPGMMGPDAYEGYGRGPGMMGYRGDGDGDGDGNWRNLSEEDATKIGKEQTSFFQATEKLRQNIYAKQLELRSEFAKENPDAEKAASLQKQISELEGQLAQKRVDYMITLRKITPDIGRSFAGRGPTDYGPNAYPPCWRWN